MSKKMIPRQKRLKILSFFSLFFFPLQGNPLVSFLYFLYLSTCLDETIVERLFHPFNQEQKLDQGKLVTDGQRRQQEKTCWGAKTEKIRVTVRPIKSFFSTPPMLASA